MRVKERAGLAPPKEVQQYNGISWPTMKITDQKKEYHMFGVFGVKKPHLGYLGFFNVKKSPNGIRRRSTTCLPSAIGAA